MYPFQMKKSPSAAARKMLRRLILGNPFTGSLYKRRYERHLARSLKIHGSACEIHPAGRWDHYALRKGKNVIILSLLSDAHQATTVSDLFDSLFSATVPVEENGFNVVNYSGPRVHTLTNGLQFEFPSFPEEPEAVDEYVEWYKPKPGETVFDLGSNAGVTVYHFSKMVGPRGRVISFEPDRIILQYLKRNIARHKLDNVTLVEAAVGADDGTARFFTEGNLGSGLERSQQRRPAGDVIDVPVISLGSAFAKFGVPNFCKMDIEGAEVETLEAAVDELAAHKTNFVVDTGHLRNGEFTDKKVEAAFRRAGYQTETVRRQSIMTYARPA
jgi:FkbM family methyltransferase